MAPNDHNEPTEDELRSAFSEIEAQPEELVFVPPIRGLDTLEKAIEYWDSEIRKILQPEQEKQNGD